MWRFWASKGPLVPALGASKAPPPTPRQRHWVGQALAAGLREIEVGACVASKHLPAWANTADVLADARTLGHDNDLPLSGVRVIDCTHRARRRPAA